MGVSVLQYGKFFQRLCGLFSLNFFKLGKGGIVEGLASSFYKGQNGKYFRFVNHMVFVSTTTLPL